MTATHATGVAHEGWRPVVGYEGIYEVSDLGRVRSLNRIDVRGRVRTGQLLAPGTTRSGHQHVVLCRDRSRKTSKVHRLVVAAFIGPCPPGMEACHADDVPANNHLSNLRWDTQSENTRDSVRNGTHNQSTKTRCPSGHPYDEENTYENRGRRSCRACNRDECRRRHQARKEAA